MSMVTLADAKNHLNITVSTYDTELQAALDAAELWVGGQLSTSGPLASTAVTERVKGFGNTLILNSLPVVSVTSVTGSDGSSLTVGNLNVDTARGLIQWDAYGIARFGLPFYTVVYQAGFVTLPADLAFAVKEVLRDFWSSQRGTSRPTSGEQAPSGMLRAQQVLDNYVQPGFA